MVKLLDIFSGAGGSAMGYYWAGIKQITGVDIKKQRDYPFEFIQADVFDLKPDFFKEFDLIHASPPCQAYSSLYRNLVKAREKYCFGHKGLWRDKPKLIPSTRELLMKSQKPYIIENVLGSPLVPPLLLLCGEMFKLRVIRHRLFEIRGFPFYQPRHRKHNGTITDHYFPVYGNKGKTAAYLEHPKDRTTWRGTKEEWQKAMQTPWIRSRHMIAEAVPPAYTRYIGLEFLHNQTLNVVGG